MKNLIYGLVLFMALNACTSDQVAEQTEAQSVPAINTKSASAYAPSGYTKVWEDQFSGTSINTDNWVVGTLKDPVSGDIVPGAAGNHLLNYSYCGYITEEDSYLENGSLVLRNQKRNYQGNSPWGSFNYTSGWVMSMHRVSMNKGYIEMKAKFPSGDKVWPAFWLIAEDLNWGPEWDIMEYFGWKNSDVGYDAMGMHLCYDAWPNEKWSTDWIKGYDGSYDCEAWHTYGFEWTDTYAKWYIDGNLMRTLSADAISHWPNEDMYIVLNNGQKSDSPDNTTTWPNYFKIDYVAIYEKDAPSQSPLLENGGFDTGVLNPWTKYGNTSVVSNNQNSGSHCAYIGGDYSGFEYNVTGLKPNTSYLFSGYVKSANSTNINICVKNYGGGQKTKSTQSSSYKKLTIEFKTGPNMTSAKVALFKWGSGAGKAWGDDFQVVEK